MSSRYDELERLQRLRESGALTDEEFQAEKRRLLGHQSIAPEEEAGEAEPRAPSRRRIWIILGIVGLLLAVVAGLMFGRMSGGGDEIVELPMPEENEAVASNVSQAAPAPDVRGRPPAEQLALAFQSAFGQPPPVTRSAGDGQFAFSPGLLRWAGGRAILVSPGTGEDCHACTGRLAVHYLEPEGDGFRVTGRWEDSIATGAYGKPPSWSLSTLLSPLPALRTRIRDGNQGYFCTVETFYELGPQGPLKIAEVPIGYDDIGALGDDGKRIQGRIINAIRDQSFDVVYSGSRAFSEHYVRGPGGYAVAGGGKSTMETC
ncbi:MAG TPA: SHOCT domain-containing protein [Allosphingosinicella sp.]|jgi:hypothetical protein